MQDYTLYGATPSVSLGAHILLEAVSAPYHFNRLHLEMGEQLSSEHRQRHPFGRVPVLVTPDGTCINENAAVCLQIALDFPSHELWPQDPVGAVFAQTWISRIVGEAHPAFRLFYQPERHLPAQSEAVYAEMRKLAKGRFNEALSILVDSLEHARAPSPEKITVMGALFYVKMRWAAAIGCEVVGLETAKSWNARFEANRATLATLEREGLPRLFGRG